MLFPRHRIFPGKIWKISCLDHLGTSSSGTVSVPLFWTGHFPFCLSPENEMGIPEFEIFYFNSRNSVLLGNFLVGCSARKFEIKNKTNQDYFFKESNLIFLFFLVPALLRDCSLCWDHLEVVQSSPVLSRIFPGFSRATGTENISLVPVRPIQKVASRPVLSRLKKKLGNADLYSK